MQNLVLITGKQVGGAKNKSVRVRQTGIEQSTDH